MCLGIGSQTLLAKFMRPGVDTFSHAEDGMAGLLDPLDKFGYAGCDALRNFETRIIQYKAGISLHLHLGLSQIASWKICCGLDADQMRR